VALGCWLGLGPGNNFIIRVGITRFNFGGGGEFQEIQLRTEDIENGDLWTVAPYPLVKGSGGSCNLVQEISFHIAKFLNFLVL